MKQPAELKKEKFTLQVNYSPEAIEKKLMKFIVPSGESFEVSAEEMASTLIGQVNDDLLAATFVEHDRVNVVEVKRQLKAVADRDIMKGEEIRLDYYHPYPVEFAIIEEGMKLAEINMDKPMTTLTAEFLAEVKAKITPEQITFVEKLYDFFKNVWIGAKRKFTK